MTTKNKLFDSSQEIIDAFLSVISTFKFTDVIDVVILTYVIYLLLKLIRETRAGQLVKGIILLVAGYFISRALELKVVSYLLEKALNMGVLAMIVLFQPELRHALDELGRKNILRNIINNSVPKGEKPILEDRTVFELVKTATVLSKSKTGALIVLEHETPLGEYINTGIALDAVVTEQLLVNIFEKNTPLHDGAVIIKNNRIVAATCYLPLTDRTDVNKELGTRHRAGLGISEATDSMTIIVSEETGSVSIAHGGVLYRNLDENGIRTQLEKIQDKPEDRPVKSRKLKKGGRKA